MDVYTIKMSNPSSQTNTNFGNAIGLLPVEVIHIITKFFVSQCAMTESDPTNSATEPFIHPSSTRELLELRLVSKIWSVAITPFCFHSICLTRPRNVQVLIKEWKDSILNSPFSPLKRLSIENLDFENSNEQLEEEIQTNQSEISDLTFPLVSMNDAAELIEFFGKNLTELTLKFSNQVGFSSELIKSIQQIKCLKRLMIHRIEESPEGGYTDSTSIAELLNSTPSLESLSIYFSDLNTFSSKLEPQAISNLKHLWFLYSPNNILGLAGLFIHASNKLKVLEYLAHNQPEDLGLSITGICSKLKCLFIDEIPTNIPYMIRNGLYRNLSVMRCIEWPLESFNLDWLLWPIFFTVRTLVSDFNHARPYWIQALAALNGGVLRKSPNFRHIVFTGFPDNTVPDEAFVKALRLRGIRSHFTHQLNYDQILELDLKLNGPDPCVLPRV
ncbi:hypothetical protein DFH28DRAFT_987196 [Melampsora americana]|nr:hypothetical protein DFH28DRAFT_987196 [Melampsora americana]